MNKNHRISLLYLLILFTIILSSCDDRQNQTNNLPQSSNPKEYPKIEIKLGNKIHKVSLNYKVNKQSKEKRKFVDIKMTHLFKIGSIQDTIFYYPTFAISDNSGNIYVLDMQDGSVKKFDSNGVFIRKYGRRGKGLGEFMSPFRIDVSEDGKLLVLDPNLRKCEILDGDKTKQFKLTSMPTGACFVDSKSFVHYK
ncbi:6-bladed beta-propeller [Melioribacteraceae bacterium 4301-Me]|uniref:6-bladed beta-propeller n=1 Tax=Pyranulibacter aquaticus TaxID=3163344 RepID=UPI003599AB64